MAQPIACSCCEVAEIPDPIHIYNPIVDGMCDDCREICLVAVKAINQARRDGVPVYGPDTWRDANMVERLEHAATHIYQYKRSERDEDHLAHAICDLVFVYATR
jgi:hypothetical protein